MEERTSGLILRTRLLTETSLIVHWLTRDFGRISTVAKGARRPKSSFQGKLDLFYLADLSFHLSRRSELHTLREVNVREYHSALRLDLRWLSQACYFVQLLEHTTETNTPLPGMLDLFNGVLEVLPQHTSDAVLVFAFEMKLLADLGLKPDLAQANLTPGTRELLEQLGRADWNFAARLRLSPAQQQESNQFLQRLIAYELGTVLKARAAAVERAKAF
jgi:DNA repair protein RecO (recombination protein O)